MVSVLFRVEKLPRRLFEFIAGAADLVMCAGQEDEVMVGRDAPSNHYGSLGDKDVFYQITRSRIFRSASRNAQERGIFFRYRLKVQRSIVHNVIHNTLRTDQHHGLDIRQVLSKPVRDNAEL